MSFRVHDAEIKLPPDWDGLKGRLAEVKIRHAELGELDKMKLQLHPTTLELAKLSSLVYEEDETKMRPRIEDNFEPFWSMAKDDYFGCVFFRLGNHTRHNQLVLAHRGTHSAKDLLACLEGVAENRITPYLNYAATFALRLQENVKNIDNIQISITGHSLGGWLAQISAFAFNQLEAKGHEFVCKQEGSSCLHCHCEVFDSPGAWQIIQKLSQGNLIGGQVDWSLYSGRSPPLDITNFVFCPNEINVVNEHLGDIYVLPSENIDGQTTSLIGIPIYSRLAHLFDYHSILNIVNGLRSMSDSKSFRALNWPLVIHHSWDTNAGCNESSTNKLVTYRRVAAGFVKRLSNLSNVYHNFSWSKDCNNFEGEDCTRGPFSVSLLSLSNRENEMVRDISKIMSWKSYFPKDDVNISKIKGLIPIELQKQTRISKGRLCFDNFCEGSNFIRTLRNSIICGKKFQIELPNFEEITILRDSDMHLNSIRDAYFDVNFSDYSDLEKIFKSDKKDFNLSDTEAKLLLMKITRAISDPNCKMVHKNNIILTKYNHSVKTLSSENVATTLLKSVKYIIVDCTEKNNDIVRTEIVQGKHHIWISAQYAKSKSSESFTFKLKCNTLFNQNVLTRKVLLNEQKCILKDFISSENSCSKLVEFLAANHKQLLIMLTNSPHCYEIPDIGVAIPTLVDQCSSFISPMLDIPDLMTHFPQTGENMETLVIYGQECDKFNENLQIRYPELVNSCIFLGNTAEHMDRYRTICKSNLGTFCSLLKIKDGGTCFLWEMQYNPNVFKPRSIIRPQFDLASLIRTTAEQKLDLKLLIEGKKIMCSYNPKRNDNAFLSEHSKIKISEGNLIYVTADGKECPTQISEIQHVNFFPIVKNGSCWIEFVEKLNPDNKNTSRSKFSKCCNETMRYEIPPYLQSEPLVNEPRRSTSYQRQSSIDLPEEDLGKNSIAILVDVPGMGKSSTLIRIAQQLCADASNWVIYGDMSCLRQIPDKMNSLDHAISFIHKNFVYNVVGQFFLKQVLENPKPKIVITFIFDGVGSANPNYTIILQLLQVIVEKTVVSLIVASRPDDLTDLVSKLGTLPHTFKHDLDKQQFLVDIWHGVIKTGKEKLKEFANELLCQTFAYVGDEKENFLGVPLHLKMIGALFLNRAKSYVEDQQGRTLESFIVGEKTLSSVFQKYISLMLINHAVKILQVPKDYGILFDEMFRSFAKDLENALIIFAAKEMNMMEMVDKLPKSVFDSTPSSAAISQFLKDSGVVSSGCDRKFIFFHNSVTGYFMARLFFVIIDVGWFKGINPHIEYPKLICSFVKMVQTLSVKGNKVMRNCLDDMLGKIDFRNKFPLPSYTFSGRTTTNWSKFLHIVLHEGGNGNLVHFIVRVCRPLWSEILIEIQKLKINGAFLLHRESLNLFRQLFQLITLYISSEANFLSFDGSDQVQGAKKRREKLFQLRIFHHRNKYYSIEECEKRDLSKICPYFGELMRKENFKDNFFRLVTEWCDSSVMEEFGNEYFSIMEMEDGVLDPKVKEKNESITDLNNFIKLCGSGFSVQLRNEMPKLVIRCEEFSFGLTGLELGNEPHTAENCF